MPGRNHPRPAHERLPRPEMMAGAMPPAPAIEDVEQETYAPAPVAVRHDGPVMTHALPARRAATGTMVVGAPGAGSSLRLLGTELKRSRVVLIATDNPFYYSANSSAVMNANAPSTAAAKWPINVPLVLMNTDEIYAACAVAGQTSAISFIVETYAD